MLDLEVYLYVFSRHLTVIGIKIWSVNIMMLKEHIIIGGTKENFEFSRPNVIWGGGAGASRSTPPRSEYDEIEAETRVWCVK